MGQPMPHNQECIKYGLPSMFLIFVAIMSSSTTGVKGCVYQNVSSVAT